MAREDAQQRTREALLDAASNAFFGDSWPESSLESLAAQAGVTKQTLLRHFGSKEALLTHALVRDATHIREQRWGAQPGDVPGAIENLLDHYYAWGERSMRVGAWQRGPAMLAALSHGARQVHYEWVDYAFEPSLAQLDGEARTNLRAALIVLCDVQTWWTLSHDLALPRTHVQTILTDLVERALAPSP